jgi:hypothetical protein
MKFDNFVSRSLPVPLASDSAMDHRARIMQQQAEMQEQRQRELLEQSSTLNTPKDRIRIWERLHQIALPRNPQHRLLGVIAIDTGLRLEDVHEEQRQRTAPPIDVTPQMASE